MYMALNLTPCATMYCHRPVFSCPDPIRGEQHVLVLCEVLNSDGAFPG
jgi:hypothetical protein